MTQPLRIENLDETLRASGHIESQHALQLRRMIYAHKVRRERDGVFGAFDCPDAGQSTARMWRCYEQLEPATTVYR